MKNKAQKKVRRSIALPGTLVEELRSTAPPEFRDNFNRLVTFVLTDFTKRQKEYQFEAAMSEMAIDPAIRKVCSVLSEEFMGAEDDGL